MRAQGDSEYSPEITWANARLIAAAPEMFEALEAAPPGNHSGHWDREGTHGANCPACIEYREWREKVRAALAKTRGED